MISLVQVASVRRVTQRGSRPTGHSILAFRPSPWLWFLSVGILMLVVASSGILGPAEPFVQFVIGTATLAATVDTLRRRPPAVTWPWWCVAAALALFLADGIARSDLRTLGNISASRSLVPDLIALPGYALLAAGIFGMSRARRRAQNRQLGVVLDGLIAALSIFAVAWIYAIDPVLLHHQTPLTVKLVLACYPPMSIFLVVVTARVVLSPTQQRVPAYWLMVAAMTAMFAGDSLYMFADIDVVHVAGRLLDLPYGLAYVAAGATVLHPSMVALTERTAVRRQKASSGRVVLVAVALLIPALLSLQDRNEGLGDRVVLFTIIVLLTGATIVRIIQALYVAERSEARLAHQAMHDSLTGLPNRRMMRQHLDNALQRAAVDDTHIALLFLDLDRFKLVNDTLGHTHGDGLLVSVAQRLRKHVRPNDLVTRIGGDEFMIVLGDVVSVSQALELANRLRFCLRAPFVVNGMEFYVSASIGLAFASGEGGDADAEALVRDADTAMYQAKDAGRDAVAVFDESMRAKVSERVELEHDLRHAVAMHQLHLVYQPILRIPHGPIEGVEALVRWAHPTLGVIAPVKFIPLAEENGLIIDIGNWVLEEALHQLATWRSQAPGMEELYVSVNLSAAQLHDADLVARVGRALEHHGLEGSALCLELTESVVMDDPPAAVAVLTELRRLDVRLAIDDFGTEYSSLSYLKRFPVTTLKIDRSFVDSLLDEDSSDATLIAAVVAMARALGITTIAEGVETLTQADRLAELSCDSVQGYLYSRPVRADRLPYVVNALWRQGDALQGTSL